MSRRLHVPLHLLFVVGSSLCAQDSQNSLCIVETKLHPEIQYDPSAGPLAIDVYKQLSEKRLSDGSPLKITVLPASVQKDIVREMVQLQCSWVLQLWQANRGPLSYKSPVILYDDVYFSLWNRATWKAVLKGVALFQHPNPQHKDPKAINPAAELANKVVNRLNKRH